MKRFRIWHIYLSVETKLRGLYISTTIRHCLPQQTNWRHDCVTWPVGCPPPSLPTRLSSEGATVVADCLPILCHSRRDRLALSQESKSKLSWSTLRSPLCRGRKMISSYPVYGHCFTYAVRIDMLINPSALI